MGGNGIILLAYLKCIFPVLVFIRGCALWGVLLLYIRFFWEDFILVGLGTGRFNAWEAALLYWVLFLLSWMADGWGGLEL